MTEEKYISGEEHQHHRSNTAPKKVVIPMRSVGLVIVVIVLCGLSFLGGKAYEKGHNKLVAASSSTAAAGGFGGGTNRGFGRRSGGIGQVTAISSTSITITNERTNAVQTFAITSSTTITDNGQTVSYSDIATGDTVLVATSSSTSTTATSIMVNPSFGGGYGGGAGGPTGDSQ